MRRTTRLLLAAVLLTGCHSGSTTASAQPTAAPATTATNVAPAAPASAAPSATRSATAPVPAAVKPKPQGITKVLTIIEENHSLSQMRAGMPYLASVATRYGYTTAYRAATHPSLPNYLAIAGGSTFGVTDDASPGAHVLHGPSVFGQTISAGGTARLYAESLPTPCGRTGTDVYAVKHAPWAYFVDERALCAKGMVNAGTPTAGRLARDIKAGALPTTGMLIPNLVHDAHDASLRQADSWLKSWLPRLMAGPDFRSGRLAIVVTADEDDFTPVNKVLTVVIAHGITHHVVSAPLNHYSLTRFYDDVAGAKPLRGAAKARSLGAAFGLHVTPR